MERTIGFRVISGTSFPITESVKREAANKWRWVRVCNGIAEDTKVFRTKREASRYLHSDD